MLELQPIGSPAEPAARARRLRQCRRYSANPRKAALSCAGADRSEGDFKPIDGVTSPGTAPDGARPLRVYLVEDAPSFRDRLTDFLTEAGDVQMAGFADSEAAALHDLRGAPPDVVIVDLHLREGSGMGVIESLRRQWPKRPPTIVVLTNYAFPEFEAAARARGADHFYDKSIEFSAVKTLLQSLRTTAA
jgi:CheY-like chemotaxis protein